MAAAAARRNDEEEEEDETTEIPPPPKSPITSTFMDDIMTYGGGFKEINEFLEYGEYVAYKGRHAIPTNFMAKWKRVQSKKELYVNDDALFFFLVHFKHNIIVRNEIMKRSVQPDRIAKFEKILSERMDWYTGGLKHDGKRVPKKIKNKPIDLNVQIDMLYAVTFREFAGKMRHIWLEC